MKTITKENHRKSQEKPKNTVITNVHNRKFAPVGVGSFTNDQGKRDFQSLVFLYGESY